MEHLAHLVAAAGFDKPETDAEHFDALRAIADRNRTASDRVAEARAAIAFAHHTALAESRIPGMPEHACHIAPLILSVPLFSITRAPSLEVEALWHRPGQGYVRYRGPVLSQSHATVLFAVLKLAAGYGADVELLFDPVRLLEQMKWSTNARNRDRLRDILDDLQAARLRIWRDGANEANEALRTGFISEWEPSATGWTVRLTRSVLQLFDSHTLTFLDVQKRAKLREGLATWLYGYISANSCRDVLTYEELARQCGTRSSDRRQFGADVRAALKHMRALKLIARFETPRGGVYVQKLK